MDTDVHITQSYAQFMFGRYLELPETIYAKNHADHYYYLTAEALYEQDGTRLNEMDRNTLNKNHLSTLAHFNIPFKTISGTWNERFEALRSYIQKLCPTFE